LLILFIGVTVLESKHELFKKMTKAVLEGDRNLTAQLAKEAVETGIDAYEAITYGLSDGLMKASELFDKKIYYVPELLLAAHAMYAGLDILKPHLKVESAQHTGTVIIGTVEGDIHDIGKNLVKVVLEAAGYRVIDLGKDVPLENFIQAAVEHDADIVAMSALLTTTMGGMKKVIEELRERGSKAKIVIGGAPVTEDVAEQYDADGYAPDASDALKLVGKLIEELKRRGGRD